MKRYGGLLIFAYLLGAAPVSAELVQLPGSDEVVQVTTAAVRVFAPSGAKLWETQVWPELTYPAKLSYNLEFHKNWASQPGQHLCQFTRDGQWLLPDYPETRTTVLIHGRDSYVIQHPSPVFSRALSPDGKYLAVSLTLDGPSEIYRLEDRQRVAVLQVGNSVICFSPDSQTVATIDEQSVSFFRATTGERLGHARLDGLFYTYQARFSDNSTLLVPGKLGLTLLSCPAGTVIKTVHFAESGTAILNVDKAGTQAVVFPDYGPAAVVSLPGGKILRRIQTGANSVTLPSMLEESLSSVQFSPSGNRYATLPGKQVLIWENGKVTRLACDARHVLWVRYGASTVGAIMDDDTIVVCDARTGRRLRTLPRPAGKRWPAMESVDLLLSRDGRSCFVEWPDGQVSRYSTP